MKMKTAKKLRTLLLVVWTSVGVILLILIHTIADKPELQKTVSVLILTYVFFSAVVAGVVARLTKIIKKQR